MDNYHLTNNDGVWKFQKAKSKKSIKNFDTKDEGLNYAKKYMNEHGGSLKIHKTDGKIQEERTYPRSNDPSNSPG